MTHANSLDRFDPLDRSERLLPRRELRSLVPVSDMTIWRWERNGLFPRHLVINGRNYWRLSELRDWVDRQQRAASARSAGGYDER
jgi:predicted DNA-binding transcriptional regulator AlpA